MRAVTVAGIVVVCAARVASAQAIQAPPPPPPEYPLEITDRPILLPTGATQVDLAMEFRTFVETTVDANGNSINKRTGFAENRTPDLVVTHAFGGVQVAAGVGDVGSAALSIDTHTVPAVFTLGMSFTSLRQDRSYDDTQSAGIAHKVTLVPGRFAVATGGAVFVRERSVMTDAGLTTAAHAVSGSAQALAELQLVSRIGIHLGMSTGVPITQSSSLHDRAALNGSARLLLAFRRWDVYSAFELGDLTRVPTTFLAFGVAKRWGI